MILQRLDYTKKAAKFSQEYNIRKEIVFDIKKARHFNPRLKRKSMRSTKDEQIDQDVCL